MKPYNKNKDAKRRARAAQQRAARAGAAKTETKVIPDKRHKPPKHKMQIDYSPSHCGGLGAGFD